MRGVLELTAPFDFDLSLRYRCSPPRGAAEPGWEPVLDAWRGREYRRVVWWTGTPALLRLKSAGRVDRPALQWSLETTLETSGPLPAECGERVRRLVSGGIDLEACYAAFRGDAVLEGLSRQFHGLRVLTAPSPYEALVMTILQQQLGFRAGHALALRFMDALGPAVEFQGRRYRGCPNPDTLAAARPEQFQALRIRGAKVRALHTVARAARTGNVEAGPATPDAELAIQRLMRLAGVGRWTAESTLLHGMGHSDALPAQDRELLRTAARLYGWQVAPTPLSLRRRWRKLAPWRGYAAYYIGLTRWDI